MSDKSNSKLLDLGIVSYLESHFMKQVSEAEPYELEAAVADTVMRLYAGRRAEVMSVKKGQRRAYYLSAEFLLGRMTENNLQALGIYDEVRCIIEKHGGDFAKLSELDDPGLGNGGLGRLAACYMDSAAALGLPLCGYGIRYKYGIFRQMINEHGQTELPDDWTRFGDYWSIPMYSERVTVDFDDFSVCALPYDIPIFGFCNGYAANIRLWEAHPDTPFDFALFNKQDYSGALKQKNEAENISRVLYPADDTDSGKLLRLRQQYFFASASLKDVLRCYKTVYGSDFSRFADENIFQLNDTHPVIAIPELIRLLEAEGLSFDEAFAISRRSFAYTNHTVMSEALESWSIETMNAVLSGIADIIRQIDLRLKSELDAADYESMSIVKDGRVRMAELALYASVKVNGVAKLHTEILKTKLFAEHERVFPGKLINITNGITQRRWLLLADPGLSGLVTRLCGNDEWIYELSRISEVGKYKNDKSAIDEFVKVKRERRVILSEYIGKHEGVSFDPDAVFDIQIKRIHEYKRQLLNALSLTAMYIESESGGLSLLPPGVFLFGGKAAPGYRQAKNVIAYICALEKLFMSDPHLKSRFAVHFVENYNVSYAELLCAAADISEQISCAGFEASGTGNMKMMLNGALTLGTLDGANIEIVKEAGRENNYIFGATVEDLSTLAGEYDKVKAEIIKKDALLSETLELFGRLCRSGGYPELYESLMNHGADRYYVIKDFPEYYQTKKAALADFADRRKNAEKGLANIAGAGVFSSDRAVRKYAEAVWNIAPRIKKT